MAQMIASKHLKIVNKRLSLLNKYKDIYFLDINHVWVDKQGNVRKDLMPDYLHPTVAACELFAKAVEPTVKELLQEK